MFNMSKEELIARLSVTAEYTNKDECSKTNRIYFFAPCGMISCDIASLPSSEDLSRLQENSDLSYFELALATPLPETIQQQEGEKFLLCKNVQVTTYSGATLNLPYMCLALKDVFGFSFGNHQ